MKNNDFADMDWQELRIGCSFQSSLRGLHFKSLWNTEFVHLEAFFFLKNTNFNIKIFTFE